MAAEVVRVRISGPAPAVARVAEQLRRQLEVAEESQDYANRGEPGVRRYLAVLVAEPAAQGGEA